MNGAGQPSERPGIATLITDALSRSADLLQTEFKLARAELTEKAEAFRASFLAGIAMMMIGCVFLIGALVLLLQALVAALIQMGMAPTLAILVVAGGSALSGIVILFAGRKTVGKVDPTPERTMDSLRRDASMAKESFT